jgi:hypothetical protein
MGTTDGQTRGRHFSRLRDYICVVHEENHEKGRPDTRPVTIRSVFVRQQSKEVSGTFRRTIWRLTGPHHTATGTPETTTTFLAVLGPSMGEISPSRVVCGGEVTNLSG